MNDIEKLIEYIKDHSNNYLGSKATLKEIETFEYMYVLLIGTLEKQLNSGWIPVKKKLPDTNKDILVTLNDGKVVPARYLFADNLNHILAWQPLPPAYKEEE